MTTTDPLVDVVGRRLHRLLCIEPDWDRCNLHGQHWGDARIILAAIEATGRLLPDGGETRELFDVEAANIHWPGFRHEADAWAQFAKVKAWPDPPAMKVLRRTITEWPDGRRHVSPSTEARP